MDEQEQVIFKRLQDCLQIDPMRLDDELCAMPQLIQEVGEATAASIFQRDLAKQSVDVACAQAARDIRNEGIAGGRKPPEDQVKTEVALNERVMVSMTDYEDAKYDLSRWQALTDALRAKSSALKMICELVIAGYLTPNAITDRRRQDINVKRRGALDD